MAITCLSISFENVFKTTKLIWLIQKKTFPNLITSGTSLQKYVSRADYQNLQVCLTLNRQKEKHVRIEKVSLQSGRFLCLYKPLVALVGVCTYLPFGWFDWILLSFDFLVDFGFNLFFQVWLAPFTVKLLQHFFKRGICKFAPLTRYW